MTGIQVLDMLSNDESDQVTLEYRRPSANNVVKTVTLTRSKEKASNPVTFSTQKLSDGTLAGYIKLTEFNAEAVPGLEQAIAKLRAQNVDELFLDLRGNLGGGPAARGGRAGGQAAAGTQVLPQLRDRVCQPDARGR